MIQSSTLFGQTLREMCGDFNPNATNNKEVFSLTCNEEKIPVFVQRFEKAVYPEIRVYPFWDEKSYYAGRVFNYTPGIPEEEENEDILYKRSRADTTVREIRSVIEIYGKTVEDTLDIRDALFERFERFRWAEIAFYKNREGWEKNGNIYINPNYDNEVEVTQISDTDKRLVKTEDFNETKGSWFKNEEGLFVNPLTSIDNIQIGEIYNGGLSFYNGDLIPARGILSMSIVRSNRDQEKGPSVPNWSLHVVTRIKDVIMFDVGKSYKGVLVNEKRKKNGE